MFTNQVSRLYNQCDFVLVYVYHLTILNFLGCFIAGLEYSADVTAEVIGKPEKTFFNAALSHLNSMITSTEIQAPIEKEGKSFAKYFYISRIVALDALTKI